MVYRTMFLSPLVDSEEVEGKVVEMGEGEAFWWTPAQQCHVLILNTGERLAGEACRCADLGFRF